MATTNSDKESDYGDFGDDEDLAIVDQLFAEGVFDASLIVTDIEDYEPPRRLRLPKVFGYEARRRKSQTDIETVRDQNTDFAKSVHKPVQDVKESSPQPDERPPLERFRKPPKKSLSVTDLVSPAWCELQYFYTLSKHGRKKRTPAMKQGTAVHAALEKEVHTIVPIDVTKKEDSWGLRIWNIIQGLRTLRDTGRTRELEIWGMVGGELVNGVIDELSYECPDPKHEESLKPKKNIEAELPEYQTTMTDYLLTAGQKENSKPMDRPKEDWKWVYITDIKTRATPTLPAGSGLRPTILQLHLYHHMLENFAQGNFPLSKLTERYDLNQDETFSDMFLAQLGNLNNDLFDASSEQDQSQASQILSSQDSMEILLQHNNLSSLWGYMLSEFRTTFLLPLSQSTTRELPSSTPQSVSELPPPASQPTCLSPLLTAEYLAPTYKHKAGTAKQSIGRKSFGFNAAFLKSYLEDSLAWWRGQRQARGVELQEAWKCRSCDYRDGCEWIHERDKAAVEEVMQRKKMREIAGVDGKQPSRSAV